MKIFNPRPLELDTKVAGIPYHFEPSEVKELTDSVGAHILANHRSHGIVELNYLPNASKETQINNIINKTLEGLNNFKEHINFVLEQYISFDTEMKQQNQYGTILNHKNVRYWTKMLEDVSKMISGIEQKYSISITLEETKVRSENLLSSIDQIVKDFEANKEEQEKANKQERDFNKLLQDVIPKEVLKKSKEARV